MSYNHGGHYFTVYLDGIFVTGADLTLRFPKTHHIKLIGILKILFIELIMPS